MARITERDLQRVKPKQDKWDRVIKTPDKPKKKIGYFTESETLDKLIAFRVTEAQYRELMEQYGDAPGLRDALVQELQETRELESININETSGNALEIH